GDQQTVGAGLGSGMKASLWFSGFLSGENSATVDATNQVMELDETNNTLTQLVPVPTLPPTCTPPPTFTPTPTPTPAGAAGDVDCSGAVTSIDAALILQFIAALTDTLPCEQLADVNANGSVDAIDATLILQFVAGLIGTIGS
ncbi:MAG: dockerin type I repeat-containing protein, partial [Chloroflexi bacterium]|nr:dockerin type I repeat-containing protein [Chloroflexota bacterium]